MIKNIEIFQIKNLEATPYAFRNFMEKLFNKKDYQKVGERTYEYEVVVLDEDVLEDAFYDFNNSKFLSNTGFIGHSLSMSDVVVVDGKRAYYCDSIGWSNITKHWM